MGSATWVQRRSKEKPGPAPGGTPAALRPPRSPAAKLVAALRTNFLHAGLSERVWVPYFLVLCELVNGDGTTTGWRLSAPSGGQPPQHRLQGAGGAAAPGRRAEQPRPPPRRRPPSCASPGPDAHSSTEHAQSGLGQDAPHLTGRKPSQEAGKGTGTGRAARGGTGWNPRTFPGVPGPSAFKTWPLPGDGGLWGGYWSWECLVYSNPNQILLS